jgi:hypothetical protein
MEKRVHFACLGTAGDVVPALALATRLAERGHVVTVGAEPAHAASIRARGFEWRAIGPSTARDWADAIVDALACESAPERRGAAIVRRLIVPNRSAIERQVLAQVADHDLTIVNGLLGFGVNAFARAGRVVFWVSGPILRVTAARRLHDAPYPILLSTSRHIFPEHAAVGGATVATGFWTGARETARSRQRTSAATPRRVLVSLSSASLGGVQPWLPFGARIASALDCEVTIVDPTCAEASRADRGVAIVPPAPHDVLLRGVDCHVHQGGSGTVGETLHAGVPSVVLPQWADQPVFGRRLVALGLAADAIVPAELTADRLIAAVRTAMVDASLRRRCRRMAIAIARERGLDVATRLVDQRLNAVAGRPARCRSPLPPTGT